MSRFRPASAASAVVAVALAAIAFGAGGGNQTGRVAPVEVAVIFIAGLLLALAVPAYDSRRPLFGGLAVALLALLTILTGLSMSWSVAPDLTLQDLGRTLTYLAVFALAAVGARLRPSGAQALLPGILVAAVAVCAWALATRIWPGSLATEVGGARLGEPFGYWNALGGMAALAVPAALWLGSRRDGSRFAAVLAYPALGVLLLTILLTQSRGALAAALVAALAALAFVPLRLRTAPVLIVSALGVAPVTAWALSKDAFTAYFQPQSAREAVAGSFGLWVLGTVVALTIAGALAARIRERGSLSLEARRRAGIALATVLAVAAVVGLVAVGTTGGGISGRLDDLTAAQPSATGAGADRFGSTSSSRGQYWRQAFDVFKDAPVLGRGADGFTLARLPYREGFRGANHAHGFLPQTLADLGLVGILVVAGLLAAWLAAAARTLGVRRPGSSGPGWSGERIALIWLALCAVAYGLQSAIDWTWFIPGPTVAALAAAGFVAGRGPPDPVGAPATPGAEAEAGNRFARFKAAGPLALVGSAALAVTALLCAWAVWQPQRSASAVDEAVALAEQGKTARALEQADKAREIDPYSADPLYARASALTGGDGKVAAYRALEQAVVEHPRDPETWLRMAQYELETLDLPARALESANAAVAIDPASPRARGLAATANGAIVASQVPPPLPAPQPAPAPKAVPAPKPAPAPKPPAAP
ncbi:MAG: O-antigen ligase family protein [Thermoleophilaceae bacterium]